ncbi:P44/Msp2 family outer membrane protein [Erythrobacter insulae]|uniref:P44/Msp2 family outer membrane protein n=1 Tax=Erythrobacter insulae TaxID=2584124 RepID=A0A547P900_9SPHN|nr:P44/Msp2 family outer membrane protein [Erythrobacter insulae]TRD10622.1 P44/Msp2 family outer membrane protein [Erythrobacter insulae]
MINPLKSSVIPAAVIAIASLPTAALAEGPYVSISGGVALPEDSTNSGEFDTAVPATEDFGAIPAGTELGWNTEFDTGFAIAGQLGYAFENGFRVEAEAAYSEYGVSTHSGLIVGGTNIDSVDVAILTRGAANAANPTVGAVIADGQGQVSNFGIFGNVFYDFDTGSAVKPYIGAGIGYQWVDVDYSPSGVAVGDDTDGVFAYQLMVGASAEITDGVELFGQYTWRDSTEDADIALSLVPATLGVESAQSILSAGIRFTFGG